MADQMKELLTALGVQPGIPEWDLGSAPHVPLVRWGKDHWSTFLYVETRWVDHRGMLKHEQMRCDRHRHPAFYSCKTLSIAFGTNADGGKYPTRLKTPERKPDGSWGAEELPGHDDYDCLSDMIREGLIEVRMPRPFPDQDPYLYMDSTGKPVRIPGGEVIEFSPLVTGLTEMWLMTRASFGLTVKGQEIAGELRAHMAQTRASHQFVPSCLVQGTDD